MATKPDLGVEDVDDQARTEASAPRSGPGWAPVIALVLVLVAGLTFFVLHQFAAAAPEGRIHPALAPSALPVSTPVTRATAGSRVLAFVPAGATYSIGTALRAADGYPSTGGLPLRITVTPDGRQFLVTLWLPVNVRHLVQRGEISLGSLPGASSLTSGRLAVSTDNAIYGVAMSPKSHLAVFRFAIARNGQSLWALNWNALGLISQSTSLQ
jgi:hypothetical protein